MREAISRAQGWKHLFIVNDFPPIIGGQSSYLHYLCRALPLQKIIVLAPSCGDTADFDRAQRFQIIRKPYLFRIPIVGKAAKIFLPLWVACGILQREKIELLHCAHVLSTGFIGLALKRLRGLDYVVYTHSADILEYSQNPWLRPWLKKILGRARFVISNSHFTRDKLIELGVTSTQIIRSCPRIDYAEFVVPVDPGPTFSRYGLEGKRVLLSINRLVERKGNDLVIMALPKLLRKFPDVVYVIFGRGAYGRKLRRLVKDMGLGDSVVFIEGTDEERKALLAGCELFVMVSREIKDRGDAEGFGVVYLEAGASGKPVVAGDSGGVRDAVVDGLNGLLVDPEDPGAVSDAIEKLLSDRFFAQRLGSRGRKRVLEEFDYRSGVAELNPVFNGDSRVS